MDRLAFKERLKLYKQAKEQNPLLKYYEFRDIPHYDSGTESVSLNEYITSKIDEVRNKAYENSVKRTEPKVPVTKDAKTELQWLQSLAAREAEARRAPLFGDMLLQAVINERNAGYENYLKDCYGSSCTATGFDNYGKNITSGALFKLNPQKAGFKQVPYQDRRPGDIVLVNSAAGVPHHTMMYSSTDAQGVDRFNHSNGGYDSRAIRHNGKYPMKNGDFPTSYTFVGTPSDSIQWKKEYYNKYANGSDGITFKTQPNSERPITGYNPVTGNFTVGYNPGAGYVKSVLSTEDLPVIGDAMDAVLVGKDVNNGNYGMAALGAGLMFLPDVIAKPIKKFVGSKLVKPVKEFFDNKVHPNLTISRNQPDWGAIINNISNMNKRDANGILLNPVNTTPKVDDVKVLGTNGGARYIDYGTIPMEASIGTPIPENMLHVIDFYNKDVFARELGDNNIYISPYRFNRSNMTFPNNKPILVRDYLDDVDFGGYASPDGTLVLAKNGGFEPDETIVHEGAHRDQFRRIEAMLKDLTEEERNKLNIIDVTDITAREKYGSGKYAYSGEHTNALNDAYTFDEEFLERYPDVSLLLEKGATNREIRYNISKENGFKFNKQLDDAIDNMTIDEIGYHMMSANSYSRSFWRDILKSGVSKEEAVRKIKYALKTVPALAPVALTLGINNKEDKSN